MTRGQQLHVYGVGAAFLLVVALWVREGFKMQAVDVAVEQGDGKTGPEYDAGFNPVEVGRRYVGTATDNEKAPPRPILFRMGITARDQSQVTVETEIPHQPPQKDTWTGTYNPATRKLLLKADPADFIELQYSNGGRWSGQERLVKGRTPEGERDYVKYPLLLSAKGSPPPSPAPGPPDKPAITRLDLKGWPNKRLLTVDHSNVAGSSSLINFPVLVSVTDASLKSTVQGGAVGKSDGSDILFTTEDDSAQLNHEIESYNESSGQLLAWVQIPALSPKIDTRIAIHFGNSAAPDQQHKNAVWDGSFAAVIHFSNPTSLSGADSTTNGNHLSSSATAATAGTGKIGGAARTVANTAFLFRAHPTGFPQSGAQRTVEAWFQAAGNATGEIVAIGNNAYDGSRFGAFIGKENFGVETRNDGNFFPWSNDGNWHHVALVLPANKGQTPDILIYLDGFLQPATAGHVILSTSPDDFTVGTIAGARGDGGFTGSVDEVRISTVARNAEWIATEYRNQSAPSSFVTMAAR